MLLEFDRPEKIIAFWLNFALHTQSLNLVSEERLSCSQTAATQLSRCHTADPVAVKACDADFVAAESLPFTRTRCHRRLGLPRPHELRSVRRGVVQHGVHLLARRGRGNRACPLGADGDR